MQKPETRFRNSQVVPFLKALRHTYFFAIQQLAIVGDPDYLLCCHGHFVALELKDDDEIPRKLQQQKLDLVVNRGKGAAIVASPSTWAAAKEQLLKFDRGEW